MVCECKGMYCKNILNDHLRIAKKTLMFYKAIKKTFMCPGFWTETMFDIFALVWRKDNYSLAISKIYKRQFFYLYMHLFKCQDSWIFKHTSFKTTKHQCNYNVKYKFLQYMGSIIKSSSFYFGWAIFLFLHCMFVVFMHPYSIYL